MLKVLLVDDEPALRDIGKYYLEQKEEFIVETAEDGEIAYENIQSQAFDVLISDYDMPRVNGIELLRMVKQTYPNLPFIIFTGKGREEVVIEALNLGVDFYIQKGGEIKSQYAELAHKCRRSAERKVAQDQIRHLARLYSFLSSAHKCIYTFRRKELLISEILKIAVNKGGFYQTVIILNHPIHGYPEVAGVSIPFRDCPLNKKITDPDVLPTFYALHHGRYHICSDHRVYPHLQGIKEMYIQEGILSSAAFPIHLGENIIGSIIFHSSEAGYFNEEEVLLLLEITDTLSFGFELMEQDYTKEKLENSLKIAWHAIDASPTPIFLLDSEGVIVYGNSALSEYLGKGAELFNGVDGCLSGIISPSEWEMIQENSEKNKKIKRNLQEPAEQKDNSVLAVRPFSYMDKTYFWIRIEDVHSGR